MADGKAQRLTVGHYAGNVQKARKLLHLALMREGVAIPPQAKAEFDNAIRAMKEYEDAKRREEVSKAKRDALV